MFYLADFLRIQAQKAASQIALRDCSEEVREFLQQNQVVRISKDCAVLNCFSCVQLCNPMNCSPPGSSVLRIFQARMLEWAAIPFSRGSSQARDQTHISYVSCIDRRALYHQCHLGSPIKRLLLIKENQTFQVNVFQWFSVYGEMQESGLTEVIPLICILMVQAQYPAFLHPESPAHGWGCWLSGCNILCLLMWLATFLIHNSSFCTAPSHEKKPFRMGWKDSSGPQNRPCQLRSENQICDILGKEQRLLLILHLNSSVKYAPPFFFQPNGITNTISFLAEIILRIFSLSF